MTSALNRKDNGNIELTVTIPSKKVKAAYDQALASLVKTTEVKGFRKGKAPTKMVEKKLGKQAIWEEVLKTLVTEAYVEAVKEQKIRPVVNPKVKIVSMEEEKDWQFTATTCELPKVKLDNYKEAIRKALASEKIWVPGKDKETDDKKEAGENQRMAKIFETLLKTAQVELPALLIEEEVNRLLAQLVDQTGRLGITVEEYLKSVNKTSEQLRGEYQAQAEQQMKLELILSAVADEEKISPDDAEIEQMIKAVPDEKTRKSVDNPQQRAYIRQVLRKRMVIDKLSKL